jgi:organic radical activating enzyme
MKPWCTEPFLTLENKVYGPWGLCCRSKPLPYGPEVSPLEHWQSDTMERIRKDMVDHNITDEIRHLCQKCIQHEERGITSRRQQKLDRYVVLKPIETVYNGFDKTDKEKFYSDMEEILPYAKMVKFTGGEPTMNKGIVEFIQWIVNKGYSKHLVLKIITNGTKKSENILKLSKEFRKFIVAVSVDGTWDIDEYQRVGTVFDEVIENIRMYKSHADTAIYSVITALNVHNVPDLVAFASTMDTAIDLSSIVLTPNHMRIEALPLSYRKHLMDNYNYPKEIRTALESEYWDEEGWNKLLELNPDIFDVIPELRGFTT